MEKAAAGGAAPAPGADAGKGSAGDGAGGAGGGAGAGQPVPLNELIPEKFRVMGADGKLDLEASTRKVEEARSHLEKRLGAGEAPPKEAKDYKVNLGEAYKGALDVEALAADPQFQAFADKLHKANFTQAQFDVAMSEMIETATALGVKFSGRISPEQCMAKLKERGWDTDAKLNEGISASVRGLTAAIGAEKAKALMNRHGNDPDFIEAWAAIGRETREDKPANGTGQPPAGIDDQITALRASEAYTNPKHPGHQKALADMTALYQKKHPPRAAAR